MDKGLARVIVVMVAACGLMAAAAHFLPDEWVDGAAALRSAYVDRFFPHDRVIDVYIELDPDDWADMLANPLAEEYKRADVIIDGVRVGAVGVRTKGNSSLRSVAGSDSRRYSLKIDFDQYVDGQSLYGLTKLNLNNSFSDPSYMREYLSYRLLAEFGIPTPAVGYANVYINGEPWGLYVTVEGVEEPMLRRYFGVGFGALYKADTGATLVYSGSGSYGALRRMTAARPGAEETLLNMLTALNTGEGWERYLNVDEMLRYFAVNTVLVNMDSYVGNFAHNYYLYEENGVFWILPWDYNMSFAGFGGSVTLSIAEPVQGTSLASRPLLARLLSVPEYRDRYYRYIEEFITGPFAYERLSAEVARIAALIGPYVANDPTAFYSYEQFQQAVSEQGAAAPGTGGAAVGGQRGANGPGFGRQVRAGFAGGFMGGGAMNLLAFIGQRIESVQEQLAAIRASGAVVGQGPAQALAPGQVPGPAPAQNPTQVQARPGLFNIQPPAGGPRGFAGGAPGFGGGGFAFGNAGGRPGRGGMAELPEDGAAEPLALAGGLVVLAVATAVVARRRTNRTI